MTIQILGSGCPKCQATEKVVRSVCSELNLDADISHVYDVREFAKYGVKLTPAVAIDGKIVFSGRVPSEEEIRNILVEIKSKKED